MTFGSNKPSEEQWDTALRRKAGERAEEAPPVAQPSVQPPQTQAESKPPASLDEVVEEKDSPQGRQWWWQRRSPQSQLQSAPGSQSIERHGGRLYDLNGTVIAELDPSKTYTLGRGASADIRVGVDNLNVSEMHGRLFWSDIYGGWCFKNLGQSTVLEDLLTQIDNDRKNWWWVNHGLRTIELKPGSKAGTVMYRSNTEHLDAEGERLPKDTSFLERSTYKTGIYLAATLAITAPPGRAREAIPEIDASKAEKIIFQTLGDLKG